LAASEQPDKGTAAGAAAGRCEPAEGTTRRRHVLAAAALIVVIGAAVYFNSFRGVFVLDDHFNITRSRLIRSLWPIWKVLKGNRPLVNLSVAINYRLGGLRPWGYHAFNLSVHIIAALALFGVVRRTLVSERLGRRFGPAALPLAAAAALIWMVHPLQTGSVTYVIQRAESMMGMFYLLALYCAVRGFSAANSRPWYAAAVLFCALGMGTKEVMVTAPLVILLYDRVFAGASFRAMLRRRWGLYAGLAATWGVIVFRLVLVPPVSTAGFNAPLPGVGEYAATQFGVILHYLKLSVWPSGLCLDPAWPPAKTVGEVLLPAIPVTALLVGTGLALWRRPALGFLGLWFFLILAPTSSFMPIADRMFEHRMYLPLAAVVVLFVVGAYELVERFGARRVPRELGRQLLIALGVVLVATLGVLTVRRNRLYHDDAEMYADVVEKAPQNARGHRNLGVALTERDRAAEGIPHLEAAVRLQPESPEGHNNYGAALQRSGRLDEAVRQYRKAIELDEKCADAHGNLANILADRRQFAQALEHFEKAITLRPRDPGLYLSCGVALARMGQAQTAIRYFQKVNELDPSIGSGWYNLGMAQCQIGQADQAIVNFRQAIRVWPNLHFARNALARVLATWPDDKIRNGPEAVKLAEEACRGTNRRNALFVDTLAAAYAEAGRFADAMLTIQHAINLATEAKLEPLAEEYRSRLKLYQSRQPYRARWDLGPSPFPPEQPGGPRQSSTASS